jgi:hypothetical protein
MEKAKTYTIGTRFDESLYRHIQKTAYKYNLKPSQVIKIILGIWYEKEKRSLSDLSKSTSSPRNKRETNMQEMRTGSKQKNENTKKKETRKNA